MQSTRIGNVAFALRRQVSLNDRIRSTHRLPLSLWVPRLRFRHSTPIQVLTPQEKSLRQHTIQFSSQTCSEKHYDEKNPEEVFFEGMGLVTATEIVMERINENVINEYGIDEVENTGRYYIARVSEAKGSIIHTLLVDKQNGMVRSLCRKAARRSMP